MGFGFVASSVLFDTDDPEFVRGCEAGIVYSCVKMWTTQDPPAGHSLRAFAHFNNAEMLMRIAEGFGLELKAEPIESDEVMLVAFTKR